tara:strand:- start:223 stop:450 length:228 start_codon:yes stop_codon:yes gene_type:complete
MAKKVFNIYSFNHGKGQDYSPGFAEKAGFEKRIHGIMTIETFGDVSCSIAEYDPKGRCQSSSKEWDGTPWFIEED